MRSKVLSVVLMAVLTAASVAAAQEKKGPTLEDTLDKLLPGMGAEKIADRRGPQQQWQSICFQAGAPGGTAGLPSRVEVCTLMAARLGPRTPNPARIWLLKQLQAIGRGECVDAVAGLLGEADPHVRDAARRCLANNPDPKATARLVEALRSAKDAKSKVGLLNALGYRGDKAGVGAAAGELSSSDRAVACAAARALGKIAAPEAARALAAARGKAKGELRFRICDAYKLCADALLKAGQAARAMAMYKELYKPSEPRRVRLAALQGMLKAAGEQAGAMVLDLLAGDDADARAIASGHVTDLSSAAVKSLAAGASKLPAAGQVLLLSALAAKGDKAAVPAALAAAKSKDEPLKVAGLRALGSLGDAAAVGLLIETMFAGGRPGGAARNSLISVYGKGIDEKIVAAMQGEKDLRRRGELIGILEARGATAAVGALLAEAVHDDANIRRRAMNALRRLAAPKDVPGMVKGMLKAAKGRERDDAEKAIMAVCQQIDEKDKRADPVLAVIARAEQAQRAILLPLLGRLGGPKALAMVEAAFKSGTAGYYEAGVRALCNWPDAGAIDPLLALLRTAKEPRHRAWVLAAVARVVALGADRRRGERPPAAEKVTIALSVVRAALNDSAPEVREAAIRALGDWPSLAAAPDLLKLARSAAKPNQRILALRGYIRLGEVAARRSPKEAVAMYQQALRAATRADEKKRALSGLSRVRTLEALNAVMPCLAQDAVKREAAAAAVSIADRIRGRHPREVGAAMEKVLASTQDKRTRQRAQEVLKRIAGSRQR